MMIGLREDIDNKKEESQLLLSLVKELEVERKPVVLTAILKSSHILLLYNALESTMSITLERVHDELTGCEFKDLNDDLRELWANYYFAQYPEREYINNLERTLNGELHFPSFKDYGKRVTPFAGNLDARKISATMKKYGITELTTPDRGKLLTVKNKRNILAHGEEMFKEACRILTIRELEECQNAVFNAIDCIYDNTFQYISKKQYRKLP